MRFDARPCSICKRRTPKIVPVAPVMPTMRRVGFVCSMRAAVILAARRQHKTKEKAGRAKRPAFQITQMFTNLTAFTVTYFSIILVIDSLLVAPTTRSTSLPSRKRIKVGMPLMP